MEAENEIYFQTKGKYGIGMSIIDTFGNYIEQVSETDPGRARAALKFGWQAKNLASRLAPDKRLMPADRYLDRMMMDAMLKPLKEPERAVIVSIFTPCELMQEALLHPYNVEAFSAYLNGTHAENAFLRHSENSGISESLCSYHRAFIGAAQRGLLPKPKCIVYTNVTCDANLLTFPYLAEYYQVPSYFIDVPMTQSEESVVYVAEQLVGLKSFLEDVSGRTISEDALKERLSRSQRTQDQFTEFQRKRADRHIPTNLATPLYGAIANNVLLGTMVEERYTQMLLENVASAEQKRGLHIYWMHTVPFWSGAVQKQMHFSDRAQSVGCELAQVFRGQTDPEKPYEAMAERLVYHSMNGSGIRRIENGIQCAKEAGADGVIWFNHWGCKHTLGNARLAKKKFEEAGLPLLILDNDGCDRSHGGEGQMSTRLEAFLEMLEARKDE